MNTFRLRHAVATSAFFCLAALLAGCDAPAASARMQSSTVDDGMDDEAITRKVVAALHAETEFSLKEVKVRTNRGDVSLSGEMATHAQIDRSLAIALMVGGVQRVENRLRAPDPNGEPAWASRRPPGSSAIPTARF